MRNALESLGIQLTVDDVKRGYDESAPQLQDVWDQNREVSTIDQIRLILKLAGLPESRIPTSPQAVQRLVDAYVEPILRLPPRLGDDVVSTLVDVRGLGVKVGLISNTGRAPGVTLRQMLQGYGVLKYFDATTFSNEIGYRKPDPRIFKQAASELGIDPPRVLHVGDNPEADFTGARKAGMNAVLFEPELQGASAWAPNSLFALSRRQMHPESDIVERDSRIDTLKDVSHIVQRFVTFER